MGQNDLALCDRSGYQIQCCKFHREKDYRVYTWTIDESKTHSFLIHFSDLFLLYNCLFLFRNMEILPNLYFADFYKRNGSSNKYTEAISGQVAGSRQTLEVAISNSVIQQF